MPQDHTYSPTNSSILAEAFFSHTVNLGKFIQSLNVLALKTEEVLQSLAHVIPALF